MDPDRREDSPAHLLDRRFKIESISHRLADAVVYLATDTEDKQPIAIKVAAHAQYKTESEKDGFLRYASTLAQISNPQMQRVFHYGFNNEGRPYLAGELPHGEPVLKFLNATQADLPRALGMISQFALTLDSLHSRDISFGVWHPDCLLVSHDVANIVRTFLFFAGDFSSWQNEADRTSRNIESGKAYLAPEQVLGEINSPQADIYGLASILFEVVNGRPYQPSPRIRQQIQALSKADPLCVAGLGKDVLAQLNLLPKQNLGTLHNDASLDRVLTNALQPNPKYRYQSALEFHDAVVSALADSAKVASGRPSLVFWGSLGVVLACAVLSPVFSPVFSHRAGMFGAGPVSKFFLPDLSQQREQRLRNRLARRARNRTRQIHDPHEPASVRTGKMGSFEMSFPFPVLALNEAYIRGISRPGREEPRLPDGKPLVAFLKEGARGALSAGLGARHNVAVPVDLATLPGHFRHLPMALDPPSNKSKVLSPFPTGQTPFSSSNVIRAKQNEILDLGKIDGENGTLFLGPGDYVASQILDVHICPVADQSGAFGPVRIFIQGDDPSQLVFRASGAPRHKLSSSVLPSRYLQIWYNGTGTFRFTGAGSFSGVVYAPRAKLQVSGINDFYGSFIVKDARITGISTFHEDPTLKYTTDWNRDDSLDLKVSPPCLSYLLYGIDSVTVRDDASLQGQPSGPALFRDGRATLDLSVGSSVKIALPTSKNAEKIFSFVEPRPNLKLPACPIPSGKIIKVKFSADQVLNPAQGEIFDLGGIEDLDSLHLAPGNYIVDHIKLFTGQCIDLVPDEKGHYGAVRLFIRGGIGKNCIDLQDGKLGVGSPPGVLQIYNSSGKDIVVAGNAQLHAAVYSPTSDFYATGNSVFCGAVLAKNVEIANRATAVYDSSLGRCSNWGAGKLPEAPSMGRRDVSRE